MELLKKLIDVSGPSGNEQEVRNIIRNEIKNFVSEVYVDKFGNLIARKKGKKPTVMLVAHMDEIGIMIKNIDDKGHIHISDIGYIEPITLLGEKIRIKTNKDFIYGVITCKEISNDDPLEKLPKINDIFIDTGLSKEELIKEGVSIGSYLHLITESTFLGNKEFISGKALDDRIGCFILIELAKKLKNTGCEIYYVFTVQEEIGLYGAQTSVYGIEPDWALIVDTTNSEEFSDRPSKILGAGSCIVVKDTEMVTNRCLNKWLIDTAKANKIPYQLEVTEKGVTDALQISVAKGGIPSTIVSVPVRNIHTTIGIASIKDVNNTIKLIELFLRKPPKSCLT